MSSTSLFVLRLGIAPLFILAGFNKLMGWPGVVGAIASKELPFSTILGAATVGVELVGGLFLLLGLWTRWTGVALLIFTLLASIFFHNFWAMGGEAFNAQLSAFLKNMAVMAGLFVLASHGGGRFAGNNR